MKQIKLIHLIAGIMLLGIGCHRGCSCEHTIDSDTERRKVDDITIKIKAEKIESTTTHFQRSSASFLGCNTSKSYSYYFRYAVKLPDRKYAKNVCRILIDKNTDMDLANEWFNMKFSSDKKHFAVGLRDNVYGVYHILEKGIPFISADDYMEAVEKKTFFEFEQQQYKSSKQIAENIIVDQSNFNRLNYNDQDRFAQTLREQNPAHKFDMMLIERWPQYNLADKVFSNDRIEDNCKASEQWKSLALKKSIEALYDSESRISVNTDTTNMDDMQEKLQNRTINTDTYIGNSKNINSRCVRMLIIINDKQTLLKADEMIFRNWPGGISTNNYLVKRLKNRKIPIAKIQMTQLIDNANFAITHYPKDEYSYFELKQCFNFLIAQEETSHFKEAVNLMFDEKIYNRFASDINYVIIENHRKLPEDIQALIVSKLPTVFPDIMSFQRNNLFTFLKDKALCKVLIELKTTYAKDLLNNELPRKCK